MPNSISVEVAYTLPEKQSLVSISVPKNCTVQEAVEQSGLLELYSEIDLKENKVGIWNRTCKISEVLQDGDRVEIYRPLIADPKEVRKLRAQKAKEEGRADKVTGGRPSRASKE